MKAIFFALELSDSETLTAERVAELSSVPVEDVKVKSLSECKKGYEKSFAQIADLYLWTCKYWYGIYKDKLTFLEIRNQSELGVFFLLQYSEQIKLAISVEKLSFLDPIGKEVLEAASYQSHLHFHEERINAIRPYVPQIERYYRILKISNNPFIKGS